jgi:H+-transporting ATPase
MSILCSDKTGTLTQNKLGLRDPICFGETTPATLNFYAYLASKKDKGSQDAIDFCVGNSLTPAQLEEEKGYKELHFEPFNPTDKRTLAKVRTPDGTIIEVAKGAPQVILRLAHNAAELKASIDKAVQDLGDRGFRSLGVGVNRAGEGAAAKWEYLGVLSLFDPPRHDTKQTIESANDFNIEVKMVTGDHAVIARETCRELGLGTAILNTDNLGGENETIGSAARDKTNRTIRDADGFAVGKVHFVSEYEKMHQVTIIDVNAACDASPSAG